MPIFDEAANRIKESFSENSTIVLGKVDTVEQFELVKRFNMFHTPNFILFRNGKKSKHEYKEDRTLVSFLKFVKKEMEDPMIKFHSVEELDQADPKKRIFIGYFDEEDTVEYNTYRKVARNLQEDCQ